MELRQNSGSAGSIIQIIFIYGYSITLFKFILDIHNVYLQKIHQMKNLKYLITSVLFMAVALSMNSQVISDEAKRKVTVGFDIFTDIWQGKPLDMDIRTINQGFNAFLMYNFQINEGNSSFSLGLSIDNHNLYSNTRIENIKADTIVFKPIDQVYQRSKINLTYISVPLEFNVRTNKGFKFGAGFKVRWLPSSKDKYIGDLDNVENGRRMVKRKDLANTEKWAYGFTLRAGYKSINLFGYYQISNIFQSGRGPQLYPISVGLTLKPF